MYRTLLIAFAATLAFPPAHGQAVPPNRLRIGPDSAAQKTNDAMARDLGAVVKKSPAIDDMMAALRDLVVAQERYFVGHDAYTTDARALDIFPRHGQAQTKVTFAGSGAWSGFATEPSLKGKSCVIYVGSVESLAKGVPKTARGVAAKKEGVPACDEP